MRNREEWARPAPVGRPHMPGTRAPRARPRARPRAARVGALRERYNRTHVRNIGRRQCSRGDPAESRRSCLRSAVSVHRLSTVAAPPVHGPAGVSGAQLVRNLDVVVPVGEIPLDVVFWGLTAVQGRRTFRRSNGPPGGPADRRNGPRKDGPSRREQDRREDRSRGPRSYGARGEGPTDPNPRQVTKRRWRVTTHATSSRRTSRSRTSRSQPSQATQRRARATPPAGPSRPNEQASRHGDTQRCRK